MHHGHSPYQSPCLIECFELLRAARKEILSLRTELAKTKGRLPLFEKTYCAQCGKEYGPGNHGYSDCKEHS